MSSDSDNSCFHCGLPVEDSQIETIEYDGLGRRFCCHGCQAVCQTIIDAGLGDYYKSRDNSKGLNQLELQQQLDKLAIYDNEQVQKSFVYHKDQWREAYLILEGIHCSACVWLNEKHLRTQPGVLDVHIDDITSRARVRWDPEIISLSQILATIAAIGYQAHPYDASHYLELQKETRRKSTQRLLFAAIVGMIPMQFAFGTWFMGGADADGNLPNWIELGRWTSLFVTLTILIYPAQEFFYGVWSDLKRRVIGMDVPIVLGLSSAFLLSAHATITASGETYFESIAMFVLFLLISRRLEHRARIKATDQLERLALSQPADAWRLDEDGNAHQVAVAELKPGDLIQILPGQQVPIDCKITLGDSSFDESLITGESKPVPHGIGEALMSGSVNYDQKIIAEVVSSEQESTIAQISRLAEAGLQNKPIFSLITDKVAARFVAVILLIAFCTATFWWFQGNDEWLVITISVLIVTCPCALALATPVALTVGASRFLSRGILAVNLSALDKLAKTDLIVLDKTGTLTQGKPRLIKTLWLDDSDQALALSVVRGMTITSEHPIANALQEQISAESVMLEDVTNLVGQGLSTEYQESQWKLGSLKMMEDEISQLSPALKAQLEDVQQENFSISGLSKDHHLIALFLLSDQLREQSAELIDQLHKINIPCAVLSGDTQQSVARMAETLKIDNYKANQRPEDKMAWLQQQQAQGKIVTMIGDGINDAPTLAAADVSFSLSQATALANHHSDFLILGQQLTPFHDGVRLARKTLTLVKQNIAWAVLYNCIAIPFAVAGLVPPWMAALGMSLSSAIVVLNSLRLMRTK